MEYDQVLEELICHNVDCPPDSRGYKDYMTFSPTAGPPSIDITCYNFNDDTGEMVGIAGISMSLADFRILESYVNEFFGRNNV